MNLSEIKKICQTENILPAKSRGQNFLIEKNIVAKIIQAANLNGRETILEVGPGLGVLTEELVKRVKRVVAVELDKKFFNYLKDKFKNCANLELINQDILKTNLAALGLKNQNYRLLANLPYNITSVFFRFILEQAVRPKEMVVMVQKEVAQRILAPVGDLNLLALAIKYYGEPKILFPVSRHCFWPKPKVDSAVIKIAIKSSLPKIDKQKFFNLIKIGFSAKRKQLQNNLAKGLNEKSSKIKQVFNRLGLTEKIRAQNLALVDWLKLLKELDKN